MTHRLLLAAALWTLAAPVRAEAAAPTAPEGAEVTVVVTGTRTPRRSTQDPVGTETIGARELQSRNVRDASRALDAEPGVQIERSFRGASIQMRGLEAKYVRVLQDGLPLVGQVNDVIDLRRYSMDGIERVEVVRGAASALYGSDALAGVVNFISRRPKKEVEASGFAQYGSLNGSAAGLYAGTRRGTLGTTLSLNWFGNDSYDLTPGDPNLSTNGDARRAGSAALRAFWTPTQTLEVLGYVRLGHFDTRGVDLQLPRALWNRRVGETEYAAGSTATWKLDELTRLTFLAQANAFERSFWRQQRQGPGLDDQHSLETLVRGEAQLDRTVRPWLTLTGGAGGLDARLSSPRLANGGAGVAAGWGFVQGEASLGEVGELLVGGRLDLDRNGGTHASPRVAVRFKLSPLAEGLSVRLGYGQGFRAPSLGERFLDFKNTAANYVVHGNEALRPEISQSFQVGVEWAPPGAKVGALLPTLRCSVFRNDLVNLIQPVDVSGQRTYFQYENYATARVQGVEAAVRLAVDRALVADVGYALLDARGTLDENGAGNTAKRALPGRAGRQWTAALLAMREASGTEASVRAQYQVRRTPLDADGGGFSPPLLLVDAKVTQRAWKPAAGQGEVQAYVSAENLTNDTDLDFLALPGRTFYVGVQARY